MAAIDSMVERFQQLSGMAFSSKAELVSQLFAHRAGAGALPFRHRHRQYAAGRSGAQIPAANAHHTGSVETAGTGVRRAFSNEEAGSVAISFGAADAGQRAAGKTGAAADAGQPAVGRRSGIPNPRAHAAAAEHQVSAAERLSARRSTAGHHAGDHPLCGGAQRSAPAADLYRTAAGNPAAPAIRALLEAP